MLKSATRLLKGILGRSSDDQKTRKDILEPSGPLKEDGNRPLNVPTSDLRGKAVVPYSLPACGTRIIVNGNVFRINYVRRKPFRFTAEFMGRYEQTD